MNAYREAFVLGARRAVRSRAVMALIITFYSIIIAVMSGVWRAAFANRPDGIAGYDLASMVWYLTFTEAVVFGSMAKRIELIGDEIARGDIEGELLRPASVIGVRMLTDIGESMTRGLYVLLAGTALSLVIVGPPPNNWGYLLGVVAAIPAIVINTSFVHALGALAFWLRKVHGSWLLYQKLVFFPGGMILPLQLYPGWFSTLSLWLPFWTIAYAPGRFGSGHIEPELFLGQLAWLVAAGCAAVLVFGHGVRRLRLRGV